MFFKRFIAGLMTAALVTADANALQQPVAPPVSPATRIAPDGASNAQGLGFLTSGARFPVGRSNIRVWKPYTGTMSVDTSGSNFFPSSQSKTYYFALEVDDDPIAAQIVFANVTTSPWTVTDFAVSGSSQLAAPTYAGATPGVTPYDASGNAVTTMALGSFGNAGLDQPLLFQQAVPASATSYVTSGSSSATTLNFGSTVPAGLSVGQRVFVPTTSGTYPSLASEVTTVTAFSASGCGSTCTVTISNSLKNAIPSGTTVYFLPPGISVAASSAPPLPNLVYSDWVPVPNLQQRIDGYPRNGWALSGQGIANGTTVSSTPANGNVPLSAPTSGFVAKGTLFQACTAYTTSAASTPTQTLTFTNTSGIVPGMYAVYGTNRSPPLPGSITPVTQFAGGGYNAVVQSVVANTSVTMAANVPNSANQTNVDDRFSGSQNVLFIMPVALQSAASSGATSVTVPTGLSIATGMVVYGTNVVSGTTVSAYNSGTGALTLSTGLSGALAAGTALNLTVTYATSADVLTGTRLTFAAGTLQGVFDGYTASGAGIPANDTVFNVKDSTAGLTYVPTAPIASGTPITFCNSWKVNADVAQGATALPIDPPKRLLLGRINVGSVGASYLNQNYVYDAVNYNPANTGSNFFEGGTCAAGTDGVLNVSAISNTAGTCVRSSFHPFFMVKTYGPRRGVTVMSGFHDSHSAGDTTTGGYDNYARKAVAKISTNALPVSYVNGGWGGQGSDVFLAYSRLLLNDLNPQIVVMPTWTENDTFDAGTQSFMSAKYADTLNLAIGKGALPILLSDYVYKKLGCTTVDSGEAYRAAAQAQWLGAAVQNGVPYLDLNAIAVDPANPGYLQSAYSNDCQHGNEAFHTAVGSALAPILQKYIGN